MCTVVGFVTKFHADLLQFEVSADDVKGFWAVLVKNIKTLDAKGVVPKTDAEWRVVEHTERSRCNQM